ncbi:hypothetical protein MAXJ12_13061 [Mesorhizobium alhagi CCNWXJ12-2]|uniref:Uncharacterized protein n=1 Tax=Mesorhizobium alhagi CCNWXJ12-2 TaxID=1107882 RepID=H0HR29_9HYPH|nr:hypothetical protein MAXJ12_13061 [Mesorhizobium alhagi CCNWXJ12-2]
MVILHSLWLVSANAVASSRAVWASVFTARFRLGFTLGIFVGIVLQAVVLLLLRQ